VAPQRSTQLLNCALGAGHHGGWFVLFPPFPRPRPAEVRMSWAFIFFLLRKISSLPDSLVILPRHPTRYCSSRFSVVLGQDFFGVLSWHVSPGAYTFFFLCFPIVPPMCSRASFLFFSSRSVRSFSMTLTFPHTTWA